MEEKPALGKEALAQDNKDANNCIAFGVGLGSFGAIATALTGVVCPICYVAGPGFLGYGAYKKYKARKKK